MSTLYNSLPITSCCRTVCDIMGVACGEQPAAASEAVKVLCEKAFAGRKADRALLYNPDASIRIIPTCSPTPWFAPSWPFPCFR